MARLTEYNYKTCKEICEKVSLGKNIVDILKTNSKYPSFPTWCKWKRENDELLKLYVNSVQDKSDIELHEMEEIQELLKKDKITPSAANVLIQTIKWKLAKFYPKMYGDKSVIDHKSTDGSMSPPKADLSKLSKETLKNIDSELDGK